MINDNVQDFRNVPLTGEDMRIIHNALYMRAITYPILDRDDQERVEMLIRYFYDLSSEL